MSKTILWFSGSFCQPCKNLAPIMEKIGADYPYDKIEIDAHENGLPLAQEWQISSVPTLILVEGATEISRKIGLHSEKDLREWIECSSVETFNDENAGKPHVKR